MSTTTNIDIPGFGAVERSRVLGEDAQFVVILDKYPVAEGHALVVPRRPVQRFRELSAEERTLLIQWVAWTQERLLQNQSAIPHGFNLGMNDGSAAGQTVPQLHFHVIPRREGDVADPRGGIRWVVPAKAIYWNESDAS